VFTLLGIFPDTPPGALQPSRIRIEGNWICAGLAPAPNLVELRLTSPGAAPTTAFVAMASVGATGQPPAGSVSFIIPAWPGLTCNEKIAFDVRGQCAGQFGPWTSVASQDLDCGSCPRISIAAPVYGACTGTPPVQNVTLNATVMLPARASRTFVWEFGDGTTAAAGTVTSTGPNVPNLLTVTHPYPDAATPYTARLRSGPGGPDGCPEPTVTVQTTCSRTACPAITARANYGECTAALTRPVTFTLTFTPALAQNSAAFVTINYGGVNPQNQNAITLTLNTSAGPVSTVSHQTELLHRPGGYSSSATLTTVSGGQLCPPVNVPVQVNPPPCLVCPDPGNPVTVTIVPSDPNWCAPVTTALAADLAARINWLAPVPANPPQPVRFDWTISAPGGTPTATRSSTQQNVSTASGWTGAGATVGGALNLSRAGTYSVSVTAVFGVNSGLPTGPDGSVTCNVTGAASFDLDPCEDRSECPVLTGINVTAGCITATGGAAVTSFTANLNDPSGSAQSFEWDFGDPGSQGNQLATATANASHTYTSAGRFNVTVRVRSRDRSCPNPASVATSSVTIAPCPIIVPPPRVTRPSCEVLLWVSLIAMLVGGLLLVVGCLIGTLVPGGQKAGIIVSAIGGGLLAIGAILFVLWALLCAAFTSCSVILAAIDFVTVLIFIFGFISAVIAIISIFVQVSWPCAFAAAANWGGWGVILAVLLAIARSLRCLVTGPGPAAASSASPLTAEKGSQSAARHASEEGTGLGDRVSRFTSSMGIVPCEGCRRRAEQLNALSPGRSA
jgi:hypothetical protein